MSSTWPQPGLTHAPRRTSMSNRRSTSFVARAPVSNGGIAHKGSPHRPATRNPATTLIRSGTAGLWARACWISTTFDRLNRPAPASVMRGFPTAALRTYTSSSPAPASTTDAGALEFPTAALRTYTPPPLAPASMTPTARPPSARLPRPVACRHNGPSIRASAGSAWRS